MSAAPGYWSTAQLAEFLVVLGGCSDEASAAQSGIERAAEALEAEVAAIVRDGRVTASLGFPAGRVPRDELVAAACRPPGELRLPGGTYHALPVPLDDGSRSALLLARLTGDFAADELALVSGMARALSVHLRLLRHAAREHEQVRLLSRLSKIQRSISHRGPLAQVLDGIVNGAVELLRCDVVGLRLFDVHDPRYVVSVASAGIRDDIIREVRRVPARSGLGGRAMLEERLVVSHDYAAESDAIPTFVHAGLRAGVAAPVHENGTIVGCIVAGSVVEGREFSEAEQEAFVAFAEHASLALGDAKTVSTLQRAFRDPLTGLPNRTLFLDRVETALSHASAQPDSVSVVVVGLDGFSEVNHRYGFAAGDELLGAIAGRIRDIAPREENVARLAGDEFAILLDGDMPDRLVRDIEDALAEPVPVRGRTVTLTASIGLATSHTGADEAEDLLRVADAAMRDAKRGVRTLRAVTAG